MHITVIKTIAASSAISAEVPLHSHGAAAFSRACACLNFLSISAVAWLLLPAAAEAAAQAIQSVHTTRTVLGRDGMMGHIRRSSGSSASAFRLAFRLARSGRVPKPMQRDCMRSVKPGSQ